MTEKDEAFKELAEKLSEDPQHVAFYLNRFGWEESRALIGMDEAQLYRFAVCYLPHKRADIEQMAAFGGVDGDHLWDAWQTLLKETS